MFYEIWENKATKVGYRLCIPVLNIYDNKFVLADGLDALGDIAESKDIHDGFLNCICELT